MNHVPDKFMPFNLDVLFKIAALRGPLSFIGRRIFPFTDRDLIDRHLNFINTAFGKSQETIFERVRGYYPADTRFIVLPMDMAYMGAGKVNVDLDAQHAELAQLRDKYPAQIIPFIAVDPRRPNILEMTQRLVEENEFKGIKLYPSLGFYPFDERLYPVYEYAQAANIPLLAHCSRGGIYSRHPVTEAMLTHPLTDKPLKKLPPKKFAHYYADPDNYKKLLKDFPDLRICLAHFGGNADWQAYLDNPRDPDKKEGYNENWLSKIADMIRTGEYPNLYTDIAYTVFDEHDYSAVLKVFMEDNNIARRVLFGSDYYMIEREKPEERRAPMRLRAYLGAEKFRLMAEENPKFFLEGPQAKEAILASTSSPNIA